MIKSILAATSLCAMAFAASAQSAVTLYGIVDASVRSVSNTGGGTLHSVASGGMNPGRLGVRGNEDMGGGLSGGFGLEAGIATDTGLTGGPGGSPFFNRRSIVYLASKSLGEVRLGRDYVPTFLAWASQDPFGNTGVAFTSSFTGPLAPTVKEAFGTAGRPDVWTDNAIQYVLPRTLGGISGGAILALGEGDTGDARKLYGSNLSYDSGPLRVTAAHVTVHIDAAGRNFKDTVLSGSYDFGVVKTTAAVRRFGYLDSSQLNYMLTALVPVGAGQVKLAYVRGRAHGTATGTNVDGVGGSLLCVGYAHWLSKRTALYSTVSTLTNRNGATYSVQGAPTTMAPGGKAKGFETGVMHSF